MENELTPKQALEKLKENEINIYYHLPWNILKDYYDIIEQALNEFETLKKEHDINMCMTGGVHYDKNNLTPKQALNCLLVTLKDVRRNPLAFLIEETNTNKYAKVIEQALTDYEKQKQILEVLKKLINDFELPMGEEMSKVVYKAIKIGVENALTENEFNLIKDWFK